MQGIDTHSQANVAWMEHQILDHVKAALRVTLGWHVPAVGLSRKLSSVQFTFQSFQRHLERLMEIEEEGGYLMVVSESKPHLMVRVERLANDHEKFRQIIEHLLPEVEALQAEAFLGEDSEAFDLKCDEIYALLDRIDRHDRAEVDLLQESLLYDEGGEG